MRKAEIYYNEIIAGYLTETDDGEYRFQYTPNYVKEHNEDFVAFTMPVRKEPYMDKRLFAFFDGLIPEGWLLNIASKNWKINTNDRMGLLMACCQNCIGAVSVNPITDSNEK